MTILGLLVVRVIWRLMDPPPPPLETPFSWLLTRVGQFAHIALYGLLAATPIVGILLQFARGDGLPLFGVIEIASPWVKDRAFAGGLKEIHETLANALIILAVLHALAALVHHWFLRDRTLVRMLPVSRGDA